MTDIVGGDIKFIRLNDKDLIGRCMESGFFEGHNVAKAAELLRGQDDGTILDIGANMGSFTIPLAFYNPQFDFVCFEPQRMVYYQLCGNVALNKLKNVDVHNIGLADKAYIFVTPVPDYDNEENIGAFSLDSEVRNHDDYLCKTTSFRQIMEIEMLDSYTFDDVRLIKIDVEGMELEVLKGAVLTIQAHDYPPIMFEAWTHKEWFQPKRKELISFLESMGYEVHNMGEDNVAIHKGNQ